jgi:glutaminyl-peptide cyclotransferase
MRAYGWDVDFDSFTDNTPYGVKDFSNIIATYQVGRNLANKDLSVNKRAIQETSNRFVFACHYDSKFFNNMDFLGAIDSAVPCAMLLDLAKFLSENFDKSQFNLVRNSRLKKKKLLRKKLFIFVCKN